MRNKNLGGEIWLFIVIDLIKQYGGCFSFVFLACIFACGGLV